MAVDRQLIIFSCLLVLVFPAECLRIEGTLSSTEVSRKKRKQCLHFIFFCRIIGNGLHEKVLTLHFMFLIELGVSSEILFPVKQRVHEIWIWISSGTYFICFVLKDRNGYIDIRVLYLNLTAVKSMLRNRTPREKYFNG